MSSHPDLLLPAEESDCIAAAQTGDRQAFARLVELYWDRLYRWMFQLTRNRHQAEDLVQETFLKALGGLNSFRPGSNFRAWLFRIGHNNFVNLKRGEKRDGPTLPDTVPDPKTTAPDVAADREALRVVSDAVADLAPEFRTAILLRAEEGMSFK